MIPIKCFTCGNVLADKYRYFINQIQQQDDKLKYAVKDKFEKTKEGKTLDDLNLNNVCCRRHILTHVEIY